jgi:Fe-S-cluster containining protein
MPIGTTLFAYACLRLPYKALPKHSPVSPESRRRAAGELDKLELAIPYDTALRRLFEGEGHLKMTADAFGNAYLEACENDDDGNEQYMLRTDPCVFLQEDGRCQIHSCKPDSCKGYPYTDRPERLFRLISVIEFARTCPVVFEILERLKAQYRFRSPSPSARRSARR